MNLNLGCGQHLAPWPWVNVDSYPGVKPGVVADIGRLPFADSSADMIYCGHVLEHLDPACELPAALAEVRRVLAPDGRLCVVGPDFARAAANPEWHPLLPSIAAGGGRYPGDDHKWTATGPLTAAMMRPAFPAAAEADIFDVAACWPVVTPTGWQFAVLARNET